MKIKLTHNLNEVIDKLQKMQENPDEILLSSFREKYKNIICPDHLGIPEVKILHDPNQQVSVNFCCQKQKDLFEKMKA